MNINELKVGDRVKYNYGYSGYGIIKEIRYDHVLLYDNTRVENKYIVYKLVQRPCKLTFRTDKYKEIPIEQEKFNSLETGIIHGEGCNVYRVDKHSGGCNCFLNKRDKSSIKISDLKVGDRVKIKLKDEILYGSVFNLTDYNYNYPDCMLILLDGHTTSSTVNNNKIISKLEPIKIDFMSCYLFKCPKCQHITETNIHHIYCEKCDGKPYKEIKIEHLPQEKLCIKCGKYVISGYNLPKEDYICPLCQMMVTDLKIGDKIKFKMANGYFNEGYVYEIKQNVVYISQNPAGEMQFKCQNWVVNREDIVTKICDLKIGDIISYKTEIGNVYSNYRIKEMTRNKLFVTSVGTMESHCVPFWIRKDQVISKKYEHKLLSCLTCGKQEYDYDYSDRYYCKQCVGNLEKFVVEYAKAEEKKIIQELFHKEYTKNNKNPNVQKSLKLNFIPGALSWEGGSFNFQSTMSGDIFDDEYRCNKIVGLPMPKWIQLGKTYTVEIKEVESKD